MSLINSILKDLDQRRQKGESNKRSFLTEVLLSAGKSKKIRVPGFVKVGIFMSLVAGIGVFVWDNYKELLIEQYDTYVSALMQHEVQSESPPIQTVTKSLPETDPVDKTAASSDKAETDEIATVGKADSGTMQAKVDRAVEIEKPPPQKIVPVVKRIKPKPKIKSTGTVAKKTHPLSKSRKAELGIAKALRMIRANNYKGAEKQLRRALWLQSDNLRARELLAMLLINLGRVSEAAKVLVDGLDIAPYHAPFAKLYARVLVNQNETSRAIAILERAQPDIVENPEYHSFLAALYQKLSMHERAIRKYQQVLSLRPNTGNWWLGLGISLEGQGRIEEALTAYQSARQSGNLNDNIITYINSRITILSES